MKTASVVIALLICLSVISQNGLPFTSLFPKHTIKQNQVQEVSIYQTTNTMTENKDVLYSYARFDTNGNIIKEIPLFYYSNATNIFSYSYDNDANIINKSSLGYCSSIFRDPITDEIRHCQYHPDSAIIDTIYYKEIFEYDSRHNIIKRINYSSFITPQSVILYTYDVHNNLINVIDSSSNKSINSKRIKIKYCGELIKKSVEYSNSKLNKQKKTKYLHNSKDRLIQQSCYRVMNGKKKLFKEFDRTFSYYPNGKIAQEETIYYQPTKRNTVSRKSIRKIDEHGNLIYFAESESDNNETGISVEYNYTYAKNGLIDQVEMKTNGTFVSTTVYRYEYKYYSH